MLNRIPRGVELLQHQVSIQALEFDFVLSLNLGGHRDQVVPPFDLHAVAGEVEETDAALFLQPVPEVTQRRA